ncbi:hypothetical protein J6590_003412 [Homalodisca vitripennis]|nr:hypothetical protein J6590_003412 [Homalodisca vitripennis]
MKGNKTPQHSEVLITDKSVCRSGGTYEVSAHEHPVVTERRVAASITAATRARATAPCINFAAKTLRLPAIVSSSVVSSALSSVCFVLGAITQSLATGYRKNTTPLIKCCIIHCPQHTLLTRCYVSTQCSHKRAM